MYIYMAFFKPEDNERKTYFFLYKFLKLKSAENLDVTQHEMYTSEDFT